MNDLLKSKEEGRMQGYLQENGVALSEKDIRKVHYEVIVSELKEHDLTEGD